jgi:endonuclease/exonuclease/phosphatase family metal-dependent hydrolase
VKEEAKKNKSIFRILVKNSFLIVAYFALFLLVLAFLSQFINPNTFWFPAFAGLCYPFIFLGFLLMFVFILFRKYTKHVLIFLPFLIYGIIVMGRFYHPGFFNSATPKTGTFKVLSYNVRLFDLYNWKSNHINKNKIFDFLDKENADILCFQEYYFQKDGKFSTTDTLIKFLSAKNVHAFYPSVNKGEYFFGIATFSKYPIVNKGEITFKGTSNLCIYTDILLFGDTVRIYNNHLESVRLGQEDYQLIDKLDFKVDSTEVKDTKSIVRRLKKAYLKRSIQVDSISAHIASCPYPVIVCGDFNDTPVSYAYHCMSSGLKDAYCEAGSGIKSTYNGKLPWLRIDFIFHSPKYKAYDFRVPDIDLSDHFPVVCMIGKKEE